MQQPPVTYARYEMSGQEEAERLALARRVGERLDDDHWLIVGGPMSLAGQLGRPIEQRIFDGEWGGHSPEMMHREYGPYEDRSIFVVIVDRDGAVACGRTIWSSGPEEPLKLEVDLELDPRELREDLGLETEHGSPALWEFATMAVEPRARQSAVIGWIIGEIRWQEMTHAGNRPSIAVISTIFFRFMRYWGAGIEPLTESAEPFVYLGVESLPVIIQAGRHPDARGQGAFRELTMGLRARVDRPLGSPTIDLRQPAEEPAPLSIRG